MAWVEPHRWTKNELITARRLNTYREAILYLRRAIEERVGAPNSPLVLEMGNVVVPPPPPVLPPVWPWHGEVSLSQEAIQREERVEAEKVIIMRQQA